MVKVVKFKDSYITNLKVGNAKSVKRVFSGKYNKKQIEKQAEILQAKYKDKNIRLMISVNTDVGFRSGKSFNANSKCIIPEDYYYVYTDGFIIYAWKDTRKNASGGSDDSFNDCLYDCIRRKINYYRLPKGKKQPEDLKAYLGLKRDSLISIKKIPLVEEFYKININVGGDACYTTTKSYNMTCNIKIVNKHYELQEVPKSKKTLLSDVPLKEQTLVMFKYNKDFTVSCYSQAEGNFTLETKAFLKLKNVLFGEYAYVLSETDNIEEEFNKFLEEVNMLKELSKGKFDLSKCGYKPVNQSKLVLHHAISPFEEPESIEFNEQLYLYNAYKGALYFNSNEKDVTEYYDYDINSCYPYFMASTKFSFPTKKGEFTLLSELPKVLGYGIYRVEIMKSSNNDVNKCFRFNDTNYYTHYDIQHALDIGLEVKLILDGETNSLLYPKGRAAGSQYFGSCIDELYKLKCKLDELYKLKGKPKLVKQILSCLWGVLLKRNKICRITTKEINFVNNEVIIDINEIGHELYKVEYLKQGKFFKTNYCRLGPFLLASVRKYLGSVIFENKEDIFYCRTDGFHSKKELPNIKISNDIGQFKVKKNI